MQMPTAADVGARPSTWMPTAADVGAVPTSRTVNGKPLSDNLSLTAANVGAIEFLAETTWMPEVVEMRNQVGGCTYDTRVGYYIRIGELILATFHVSVSKKSTAANWDNTTMVCIRGLPGTRSRQDKGYSMGARVTLKADAAAIAATTQMTYGTVAFARHDGMVHTSNLGDGFVLNGSIAYIVR